MMYDLEIPSLPNGDLLVGLRRHPRLIPLAGSQSHIDSLVVETIQVLCAGADGPQRLGVHIAELSLGVRYKVRPARRAAFTEGRGTMGGQMALDQPGSVAGRDRLSAGATGGGAFVDIVADSAWILLLSEAERRLVVAETLPKWLVVKEDAKRVRYSVCPRLTNLHLCCALCLGLQSLGNGFGSPWSSCRRSHPSRYTPTTYHR